MIRGLSTLTILEEEASEEEPVLGQVGAEGTLAQAAKIDDLTGDDLKLFKRRVYLVIVSSLSFEECAHKLVKSDIPEQYEKELCQMIVECCAQEKTYRRFYGLLGQRFCELRQVYRTYMMELFQEQVRIPPKTSSHILSTKAATCWKRISFETLLCTSPISYTAMRSPGPSSSTFT